MEFSTVDRNVVILFDQNLTDELIRLSQSVNEVVRSKILLNHEDQYPHLSLYITKYPSRNINEIMRRIRKIAQRNKPFKLWLNARSCHSSGTIFIDAEMSDELYSLHERLLTELNPLRGGLYNEDELNLPGMTEKHKQSLINYGMWAVKEDFVPHVSIGRLYELTDCEAALKALPKKINLRTEIKTIAFVETGPNGTCKKVIETFPFRW